MEIEKFIMIKSGFSKPFGNFEKVLPLFVILLRDCNTIPIDWIFKKASLHNISEHNCIISFYQKVFKFEFCEIILFCVEMPL